MAVNLEAERARQAKVSAPQRAALEKKRYLEALRCQILEGATQVAANHKGAGAAADKARLLCLCAVGVESGGGLHVCADFSVRANTHTCKRSHMSAYVRALQRCCAP
jgi:hypothetical protein